MLSRTASSPAAAKPRRGDARGALIDTAHALVRRQGWAGTSIDALCLAAGVTKGAFFHHFASKEALGVAAAEQWTARAQQLIFELPDWTRIEDPLERVLAHLDFRLAMMDGPAEDYSCFVGTMVQETFATSDALRTASNASITAYSERFAQDIQQAIDRYGVIDGITASDLAYHTQAVLQGAFILAKAKGDSSLARNSIAHLKRYVRIVFGREPAQ